MASPKTTGITTEIPPRILSTVVQSIKDRLLSSNELSARAVANGESSISIRYGLFNIAHSVIYLVAVPSQARIESSWGKCCGKVREVVQYLGTGQEGKRLNLLNRLLEDG